MVTFMSRSVITKQMEKLVIGTYNVIQTLYLLFRSGELAVYLAAVRDSPNKNLTGCQK